jgi:hypothetical protein
MTGTTTIIEFILSIIWGLFLYYKSKKLDIKLLSYLGLFISSVGLVWLAPCLDFLKILLTGTNLNKWLYAILGYVWAPITACLAIYIGAELMIPKYKWYLISTYIILGIIFELLIFFNIMNSVTFVLPDNPGENIIDARILMPSATFIIMVAFLLGGWILNGIGFIIKGIKSKRVIRKKYLFLSVGFNFFIVSAALEVLLSPGIFLIIVRIGMISSTWFWYLGLREEPEKPSKINEKEIEVAESLFRLSIRPEHISEEVVTFHKERKICLVCKTKVSRIIYNCPGCDALYCISCSDSLSNLENACWVCNTPFDESKPKKPYVRPKDEGIEKKRFINYL